MIYIYGFPLRLKGTVFPVRAMMAIPLILNLGTRWRWVVIFTPRPLNLSGSNPGTH
jgi:hypothetical protein